MKRVIFIAICSTFILNLAQAKKMPDFVQQRLDLVKKETKRSLTDFRIWGDVDTDGYMTLPRGLSSFFIGSKFSDNETELIDSLDLKLNIGMIYDNEMRDRIVQLMRNEYRKDELDTLVNRYINRNLGYIERQAMEICKVDTFSIVKKTTDSLYVVLEAQNILDMFKKRNKIYYYEVFKSLQLDTTEIFKQVYTRIREREREREKNC